MHCGDPSCVSACPVSAMTKDPVTGVVGYNVDLHRLPLLRRGLSVQRPPLHQYDSPVPAKHRQVRAVPPTATSEGNYSACAEVCPTGATLFGPVLDLHAEIERRRALAPGTQTVFPRGKIGGTDTYEGPVGTYVERTYGEHEIGGTQVLHLSGVPFELLNKPELPRVAPASISESLQHAIYNNLIAPLGFLGSLAVLAWRNMRPKAAAPKPAPTPAATDDDKAGAP
jgi:ferredoxin